MANNRVFIKLYERAKVSLDNPTKQAKLRKVILEYFDANSDILSAPSLAEKPVFLKNKDQEIIFESLGLTREELQHAIETSDAIEGDWKVFQNEFYLACTLVVRYFVEKKNEQLTKLVYMYLAVNFYSSLHRKYFPTGSAKAQVMNYTIENLTLKFDIKRLGSLKKVLIKIGENLHTSQVKNLMSDDDNLIIKYPTDMRSRLNSMVKRVRNEFEKNYKSGKYINTDNGEIDMGDGETSINNREQDSTHIASAAQRFYTWFLTNRIDDKTLEFQVKVTRGVSENALKRVIESARLESDEEIQKIATGIFNATATHLNDNTMTGLCSSNFFAFALSLMKKNNTSNPDIRMIRDSLDVILTRYFDKYAEIQRQDTKLNYRAALYTYIVRMIMVQRCGV